jgi:hypothetical protein
MDSLCLEIVETIVSHLFEVPPIKDPTPKDPEPALNVAQYATISRKWQTAVEHFTMADIKKHSTDFDMFCRVFSCPRRRRALRKLHYEIDLPKYSLNSIYRFEKKREVKVNNIAFDQGVMDVFDALSSWKTQGIELTLSASSPTDPHKYWPEYGGQLLKQRWGFGKNYLALNEASLPQLPFVEGLKILTAGRSLHPLAIGKIVAALPNLEQMTVQLVAPKIRLVDLQNEHRLGKIPTSSAGLTY